MTLIPFHSICDHPFDFAVSLLTERVGENDKFDLLVGNREWMKKNGLKITNEMDSKMSTHEHQGQTAVLCAINGECGYVMLGLGDVL